MSKHADRVRLRAATNTLLIVSLLAAGTAAAADLVTPGDFVPLTADRHAAKVGDIVTIVVVENASASNSADVSTDKSFSIGAEISTFKPYREGISARAGDQLEGRGRSALSGRLVAQLSVFVQAVLPNGDLQVRGNQELNLNGEKTRISIQGRLRARDVSQGNVALSSRLADAQIEYVGDGYLAERARPGWIPRIFSWLGLW